MPEPVLPVPNTHYPKPPLPMGDPPDWYRPAPARWQLAHNGNSSAGKRAQQRNQRRILGTTARLDPQRSARFVIAVTTGIAFLNSKPRPEAALSTRARRSDARLFS